MKRFLLLSVLLAAMTGLLQGCVTYVYGPGPVVYGPGPVVVGWHPHHHGWWDASTTTPEQSANLLAQNYGISQASAQTIVDFAGGNNSDQIMNAMGVSASDLAPLSNAQMPSQQTIQTIASNLNENPRTISNIFSDFIKDAQADNANSGN